MRLVFTRLLVAVFAVGVSGVASGCLVQTRGHGHARARSASHGKHEHCHYKGGKHKKQVCHSHPHDDGHH